MSHYGKVYVRVLKLEMTRQSTRVYTVKRCFTLEAALWSASRFARTGRVFIDHAGAPATRRRR